jgi:YcxB-like protein
VDGLDGVLGGKSGDLLGWSGTWYLDAFAPSETTLTQMDNVPEVTVTYDVTRREVATWYWRLWKKTLWKFHAALLVTSIALVVLKADHWPPLVIDIVRGIAVAVAVIAFAIAFPQIVFKRGMRTLNFDKNGVRTKIGKKSGSVSWRKIASITDSEGTIVISRKNLNAFLVPQRAFHSEQERASVLSAIRALVDLSH